MTWQPDAAAVGSTLTMRIRTPVGIIHVVGELLPPADGRQRLRRRDGAITEFDAADVDVARVVPDPPSAQITPDDLERIAALGWRAATTEPLGEWLLRASGGQTWRANSALAVGDPGRDLDTALAAVTDWYAARHLSPRIQVVADGAVDTAVRSRGWQPHITTRVMAAEIGHVLRAASPRDPDLESRIEIRLDDAPDAAWLATWREPGQPVADSLRETLLRHDLVRFVTLPGPDGGHGVPEAAAAVARITVDGRWAGLFCVAVHPSMRGRGLGRAVTVEAVREAGRLGGRRMQLQVVEGNEIARGLYASLGFRDHHGYRFLTPPG